MLGVLFLSLLLSGSLGFDVERCRNLPVTLNIVLLEDEDSLWSLKYVQYAVQLAIERENQFMNASGESKVLI